ncbi:MULTISPECIES: aldo/keto reductase [unclassified Aureimonas]|uniref:aldo/keto reductase n=1 Tax=unclassified Aureimonas TaxID=2615206 RepID=UPI0006F9DBAF|nr:MULTISPECIES: aldo/keto reductase [unclassified Aureimonas]KQT64460.1 hypothetical protein ASG62_05775 [Aureimonas sp. Leaf427]KQT81648.1 hypothetical protein ASG54_03055 [Aureimonas sp. Leaf460]
MRQTLERRRLGRSDLEIPVFGFGAAHLGEFYARLDEAEADATLGAAWDEGVRFFDTAPWYGRGLSEHRLGGFLRTRPRGDFAIVTKVGRILRRPRDPASFDRAPWTGGLNFEVEFDYSYDGFMRAYEQSLMRLGLDTVDALVIHDLDIGYQVEEERLEANTRRLEESGIKALEELKRDGQIKAYGMGVNTGHSLETTARRVDLDFVLVAMPYTLLDQDSLHRGMAGCVERGVGVIIGSPFASGILATGSGGGANYGYDAAPEAVQAKVRGIESVCARHGVPLPAAALQFPLAHPAVAAVIPGGVSPAQIRQNLDAIEARIPDAFWAELTSNGLIDPAAPTPPGR